MSFSVVYTDPSEAIGEISHCPCKQKDRRSQQEKKIWVVLEVNLFFPVKLLGGYILFFSVTTQTAQVMAPVCDKRRKDWGWGNGSVFKEIC